MFLAVYFSIETLVGLNKDKMNLSNDNFIFERCLAVLLAKKVSDHKLSCCNYKANKIKEMNRGSEVKVNLLLCKKNKKTLILCSKTAYFLFEKWHMPWNNEIECLKSKIRQIFRDHIYL